MPRHTKKNRSKRQKTTKRRRISVMRFKSSNRPPRRSDVFKNGRTLRGGSYGAATFPASFPAGSPPTYNEDPNRYGISASTQPDIKGGSRRLKRAQRGGSFHQTYLNSINSISNLSNAGVAGNGILHPPLITDITGVSAFGSALLNGAPQISLTNTNPPLA